MSIEKVCTQCGISKSLSEFYDRDKEKGWKFSSCKNCCKIKTSISRETNPDQWKRYRRGIDLKHRYGITAKEYDVLLSSQAGVCAICSRKEKNRRLAVDHDHKTGTVRGLLCQPCNRTLGHLENNMTAMLVYLTPEYGMSGC